MTSNSQLIAHRARQLIVELCHRARASHVGSSLGCVDILAVLYADIVRPARNLTDYDGDVFVLSKGHAAAALYAVLHLTGHLSHEELKAFCTDGSPLTGHVNHLVPGIDVSTGSLGQGLGIATGVALARRVNGGNGRAFVMLSDGECDEGAVWEAALLAGHGDLSQLVAVVDYNRLQGLGPTSAIVDLEPFAEKWRSFGWEAVHVDGHDHAALAAALAEHGDRPRCILAETIKGRGVPFMEGDLHWHYQVPSDDALQEALAALRAIGDAHA